MFFDGLDDLGCGVSDLFEPLEECLPVAVPELDVIGARLERLDLVMLTNHAGYCFGFELEDEFVLWAGGVGGVEYLVSEFVKESVEGLGRFHAGFDDDLSIFGDSQGVTGIPIFQLDTG